MLRPTAIAGVEPTLITPEESKRIHSLRNAEALRTLADPQFMDADKMTMTQNGTAIPYEKVDTLFPESLPKHKDNEDPLPLDAHRGLRSPRAIFFLIAWYIFSAFTLFQNKYILSSLPGDPTMLSTMQMLMTGLCGFFQLYLPCGMYRPVKRDGHKPPNFYKYMLLVGSLRFCTVFLGVEALKFVEVSFTETVKSSAPIFTVLIAFVFTGERTGLYTQLSLIPIMTGLALCCAYEFHFNITGLLLSLGTNFSECMQNVFSKLLISGDKFKYTPAELQYYTSVASFGIQIVAIVLLVNPIEIYTGTDWYLLFNYITNGIFFHYQTICAYVLMAYISPVTHSVANTVKRALLIWSSVLIFGNLVTPLSGLGTIIVTVGVLLYNKARSHDQRLTDMAEKQKEGRVSNL